MIERLLLFLFVLLIGIGRDGFPIEAVAAPMPSGIDYPSAWECNKEGKFYWYCEAAKEEEEKQREAKEEKGLTKEEAALKELERLRKELEAKRALAILEPTPENIKAYIAAQEAVMNRASVFSDVWRRVIWQNPELNYELKRPVNNAAIDTYNKERWKAQMAALNEIRENWGVFFIFRSDCPYCHRMASTLKMMTEMYGIEVTPVSVDGIGLPEYPNPLPDNGIVARLGITQVPTLVLANPREKKLIPIGSGVISISDIIERIYILTQTKPGDLY